MPLGMYRSYTPGADTPVTLLWMAKTTYPEKFEDINITDENREIIFTNLVDTDMLFGHRNDAEGYGKAIEEIDSYLEEILPLIGKEDLLIITADHGCDPTVDGTDHTREYVPVLYYSNGIKPKDLGLEIGFDSIANRVDNWLF